VVIFDCNGVLVDSEPIASAVLANAFRSVGVPLTAEEAARQFHRRRSEDIFAAVELATKKRLPSGFRATVAAETLVRLRNELHRGWCDSASNIDRGKPAPDLFLNVADWLQVEPQECIVVEDSAAGIAAASAAGMSPIGFIGGSHAGGGLTRELTAAGARTVIADKRALKGAIIALRGW
jgi:beta-phosphoglucomutase-like phosphatase (HAD superfamily)